MSAYETGHIFGTIMLLVIITVIALLLGASLYRRIKYPQQKHISPVLYWILFTLGTLFVLMQIIGLLV